MQIFTKAWKATSSWFSRKTGAKHAVRPPIVKDAERELIKAHVITPGLDSDNISPERDTTRLVQRMREDYAFAVAMNVIKANARRVRVVVSAPEGADDRAKALARHMTKQWDRNQERIFEALEYGRAAFQLTSSNNVHTNNTELSMTYIPMGEDGKKVSSLRFVDGKFDGIDIKTSYGEGHVPSSNSWYFAYNANAIRPYGRSIYEGAPQKVRMQRMKFMELREKFMKRFVFTGYIAHIEATVVDAENGKVYDNFDLTAQKLEALETGGSVLLSNKPLAGMDGSGKYANEIKPLETNGNPSDVELVISKTDVEASRSLGVHEAVTTSLEGGSQSSLTEYVNLTLATVEAIVSQAVEAFEEQFVPKQVAVNYASGAPTFNVSFIPLTSGQDSLLTKIVLTLLTSPAPAPLVASGAIDVEAMVKASGIPLESDAEKQIKDMVKRAKEQEKLKLKAARDAPKPSNEPANPGGAATPDETPGQQRDPNKPVDKNLLQKNISDKKALDAGRNPRVSVVEQGRDTRTE